MADECEILFEDNHLLVVNKPPGMSTMGFAGDGASGLTVHRWGCDYLRRRYHKPGKVYLGVVHRLDQVSSGVLVLARTSKAASRLSEQFRRESSVDAVEKLYLAVVRGRLKQPSGQLRDSLAKNEQRQRMEVVAAERPGAMAASLDYEVIETATDAAGRPVSLLRVTLHSGRKHQIRVQLAHLGHPIDGDRKYGDRYGEASAGRAGRSVAAGPGGLAVAGRSAGAIALHAWRLSLIHPTIKTRISFVASPPVAWKRLYHGLRLPSL